MTGEIWNFLGKTLVKGKTGGFVSLVLQEKGVIYFFLGRGVHYG